MTRQLFCSFALAAALLGTDADTKYLELVKRAQAADTTLDFKELRFSCVEASHCDARDDSKDMLALRRAFQEKHFKDAAKLGERLIDKGFPNIEAHILCARAYESLGKTDDAVSHERIAKGLISSILNSGDGKSRETAFVVIGTFEEYLTASVLGLPRPTSQSLVAGKPHSYDLLVVNDPKSGEKIELYFNIDAFFPMKGLR